MATCGASISRPDQIAVKQPQTALECLSFIGEPQMRAGPIRFMLAAIIMAVAIDSSAHETVVRTEPAPGAIDNPFKGWCPYTDAGPIHMPYSMVFQYVSWKALEPEEGRFEFASWEHKNWYVPAAKGKHIILRVYIDYPSKPSGLPDWLRSKVKLTRYTDHGGGLSPDYDDPRMVAAMERLIAAMGKRYDRHDRIAFVELGLLGFWGEWHTFPRQELYAKPATETLVIDAYRQAFPTKILMARYARDHAGAQPWLGFHDDLFPEDTDNGQAWSFLSSIKRSGRDANWKHAAIGGEMVPNHARDWLLGKHVNDTLRISETAHFSWVGPYCPALEKSEPPEFRQAAELLVRRMGYQFRLTEFRHTDEVTTGGNLDVAIAGINEGVAPFYYPWPLELALFDLDGKLATRTPLRCDIREWLPGPFHTESRAALKARAGRYRLALGIIDPWTSRPAIRFANALPTQAGWTILSTVAIAPAR